MRRGLGDVTMVFALSVRHMRETAPPAWLGDGCKCAFGQLGTTAALIFSRRRGRAVGA